MQATTRMGLTFVFVKWTVWCLMLILALFTCKWVTWRCSVCCEQKQQLLHLNVLELFMLVSLDDGTVPPIKYQYAELSKLYAVVSQLVRCCDVSEGCHSSYSVSLFLHANTISSQVVSNGYTSKCSGPYWSNPHFLIFLTFGDSGDQGWVPEGRNIKKL